LPDPGRIAAGPGEALYETKFDRVSTNSEDDGAGCGFGGECGRNVPRGGDYGYLSVDQICHHSRQAIVFSTVTFWQSM